MIGSTWDMICVMTVSLYGRIIRFVIKIKKAFLSRINSGKESFFTVQGVLLNDVSRLGLFDTIFIRKCTIPVVLAYNCKL